MALSTNQRLLMSHGDDSHTCGKITSLLSSEFSIYNILGKIFFPPSHLVFFKAV